MARELPRCTGESSVPEVDKQHTQVLATWVQTVARSCRRIPTNQAETGEMRSKEAGVALCAGGRGDGVVNRNVIGEEGSGARVEGMRPLLHPPTSLPSHEGDEA